MSHPTKHDLPHKKVKNPSRGTKSMKASKKRPLVFSTTLRKLVRAQVIPVSNKHRYREIAISQSIEKASEATPPKATKLHKGRLKASEMTQEFTTETPTDTPATPGPYLGPINSVMLTAWKEALARKQEQTRQSTHISTNQTPVEMNKGGKSSQQRAPNGIPLEIRRVSKVQILTVCERVSTI